MNTGGFTRESRKDEDHHSSQRKPSVAPGHSVPQGHFLHPPTRESRPTGGGKFNGGEGATSEGETTEDEFDGNTDHNANKGTPSGGTNRLTV